MNLLVDTSVWSLALRRDAPPRSPEVAQLRRALESNDIVFTTGVILQELLQGIRGPRARETIISQFRALPFVLPDRQDHIAAAALHSACRRRGIQVGTIDALLAQLCVHHDLTMLTTDKDFVRIAAVVPFAVWPA
ncbi:MAG: type II toxin-antitoxin system VapC family toxin [Gemmatimonadaceae bacterium]